MKRCFFQKKNDKGTGTNKPILMSLEKLGLNYFLNLFFVEKNLDD